MASTYGLDVRPFRRVGAVAPRPRLLELQIFLPAAVVLRMKPVSLVSLVQRTLSPGAPPPEARPTDPCSCCGLPSAHILKTVAVSMRHHTSPLDVLSTWMPYGRPSCGGRNGRIDRSMRLPHDAEPLGPVLASPTEVRGFPTRHAPTPPNPARAATSGGRGRRGRVPWRRR